MTKRRTSSRRILLGSAKLKYFDPEAYLRHVLQRIADHPIDRVDELLLWNVVAQLPSFRCSCYPDRTEESDCCESVNVDNIQLRSGLCESNQLPMVRSDWKGKSRARGAGARLLMVRQSNILRCVSASN